MPRRCNDNDHGDVFFFYKLVVAECVTDLFYKGSSSKLRMARYDTNPILVKILGSNIEKNNSSPSDPIPEPKCSLNLRYWQII